MCRTVVEFKVEGSGMAEPAGKSGLNFIHIPRTDVNKCGGTWSAIEIFVGAAHCKIDSRANQIDGKRAHAVRQIPKCDHAVCVSGGGQGLHVVFATRAIVDLGQHQDGNLVINVMTDLLGGDSL